jgi:hypothetical protein
MRRKENVFRGVSDHKIKFFQSTDGLPLRKQVNTDLTPDSPLTAENIRKMEENIFVRLRQKNPMASRRELRKEARRRLKVEVKRRKEVLELFDPEAK